MKIIFKILLLAVTTALFFTACDKADNLPFYKPGVAGAPVLTSSAATIAPLPADSNNNVITFSWTKPDFATDSANIKYIIEIDSAGKNFSNAVAKTINGKLNITFTAKELNTILLGFGFAFNTPYDVEVRITSSYANNNQLVKSNIIILNATPYKTPPKVTLPASGKLFLVGNATAGGDATGWNNPVPVPTQEFSRLDETTFAGVFLLNAGKTYLLLPVNGSWDAKFGGTGNNNANNVDGDDFKLAGGDLKAPAVTGMYKIIVDFQSGKFTTTPYEGTLATDIFIVGNATPGADATGWNNPVPVPSQQFTRINASLFEITMPLIANKTFLLLPVNGSWDHKYGGLGNNNSNNVSGDDFKYDGSDLKAPAETGNYKISINFAASNTPGASGSFTVIKQ